MGLFDFLRKGPTKSDPPARGAVTGDKKIAALARVATDKRAQTYDRMEAIQSLVAMKTPEAASALMKRFSFSIDPSITDQDEKEVCFQAIVIAGKDVLPAVREFCERADALTWPIKILREILDDAEYENELLDVLARFDTEYTRSVDAKVHTLVALAEVVSEEVRESVEAFLEDVNETVRFHAAEAVFAQNDPKCLPAIVKMLASEESVRIKNKVAEALAQRHWPVPSELREPLRRALGDSDGYGIGPDGIVTR